MKYSKGYIVLFSHKVCNHRYSCCKRECNKTSFKIAFTKIAFSKLNLNTQNIKGRPRKYSDEQIVACMLYGVKNSIFSLRELESLIGLKLYKNRLRIEQLFSVLKGLYNLENQDSMGKPDTNVI